MKVKSAYEIAMEKASKMEEEVTPEQAQMELREKIRPLLRRYYKDEIASDELWEELKGESSELLREAQKSLIESMGLRISDYDLKKRREGLLAIENLKDKPKSSRIEQYLSEVKNLIDQYSRERENMAQRIRQELQKNSQYKMRPVQTEDGRTVMQMDPSLDENLREQINNQLAQLDENCNRQFNTLIEKLKSELGL